MLSTPTNRTGSVWSSRMFVTISTSEATIGISVNARNPMIHGAMNRNPQRASVLARAERPRDGRFNRKPGARPGPWRSTGLIGIDATWLLGCAVARRGRRATVRSGRTVPGQDDLSQIDWRSVFSLSISLSMSRPDVLPQRVGYVPPDPT